MVRATLLGFLLCALTLGFHPGSRETLGAQEIPERPDTLRLTVAQARRLSMAQNPSLLVALERVLAARGDLRGARTYPFNPDFEIESPGSLTQGSPGSYEIRFGQEVEWAGQRGLRISAAEAGLSAERGRVLDEARQVLAQVEGAYISLGAAEHRLVLAEEIRSLNEQLLDAVRIQLREGEVSQLQTNLAEVEAGRSRARVLSAVREVSSAGLELGRLLGRSTETVLSTSGTGSSLDQTNYPVDEQDQLVRTALEGRPDLAASLWDVDRTGSLLSLASRELIPNLKVGTIADRGARGEKLGWGVYFGVSLPFLQRNQGLRIRRDAELREASMRVLDVELQVRKEVVDALRTLESANQEMVVFEEEVLEPARQNQALLDTAYSEGKIDLSSLLLLRNQLLDAEMEYLEAWERRERALIDLRKSTAAILDGVLAGFEEKIR